LKIAGQAFGVGAFEEDDEDVYARDDMSNYDFSLPTGKVTQGTLTEGEISVLLTSSLR
jgi:hypothetical protein